LMAGQDFDIGRIEFDLGILYRVRWRNCQ